MVKLELSLSQRIIAHWSAKTLVYSHNFHRLRTKMWLRMSRPFKVLMFIICFVIFTSLSMQAILLDEYRIQHLLYGVDESLVDRPGRILQERQSEYYRYEQYEGNMTGPGEGGVKVKLTKGEQAIVDEQIKKEGFSEYLNSKVSVRRSLPDYRHMACKNLQYPSELPTASVILIFCNELTNVILRTVHSVIHRTPPQYLQEVILVDDASTKEELKEPLEDYLAQHWPDGLVRLIRLPLRSGLIRTRLAGVYAAKGDVVIMMDAHMEVTKGWVEPLLARIKQNNRTLVASGLDYIFPTTLEYKKSNPDFYQTFTWHMEYRWVSPADGNIKDPLQPIPSYALVGCIMGMNRLMFLEMGAYDAGMTVWGGENVELPIRMWMCGGRVEIIPCSRVAHTFRAARPWSEIKEQYMEQNIQRIAEVWLDEYKEEFYTFNYFLKDSADAVRANLTDRIALRERLHCKSFHWFVTNIVKPPVFRYTLNNTAFGKLINQGKKQCLDTLNVMHTEEVFGIYTCARSTNQLFTLKWSGHLGREAQCVVYRKDKPGGDVLISPRCEDEPRQRWIYDKEREALVHEVTKLCLDTSQHSDPITHVVLNTCNSSPTQRWTWQPNLGHDDVAAL